MDLQTYFRVLSKLQQRWRGHCVQVCGRPVSQLCINRSNHFEQEKGQLMPAWETGRRQAAHARVERNRQSA